MTCCSGPTRCVGCEVDGIPLEGADWISDEWMTRQPEHHTRQPAPIRVAARRRTLSCCLPSGRSAIATGTR